LIREVDIPNLIDLIKSIRLSKDYIKNNWDDGYFVETSSARASVSILMNYLLNNRLLKDNSQMILMPKWICNCFTQTIRNYTNPVLSYNTDVKMVLVYHQYGFPQDMDEISDFCDRKKIMIIEDCAHAISGSYKNTKLGRFGYASVYSFSKFFPSIWGGGLFTNDEKLYTWSSNSENIVNKKSFSLFAHISKYQINKNSLNLKISNKKKDYWNYLNTLLYPGFKDMQKNNSLVKTIVNQYIKKDILKKRVENYNFILKYFKNTQLFSKLETENIYPYVIPLLEKEEKLSKLNIFLNDNGIKTGIYHFDENRNIFNPDFKRCIWLPVHEKVSNDNLLFICESVKKIILN
jgi:dTDP-4-amino-4,6-dideoxygalactose transaminase